MKVIIGGMEQNIDVTSHILQHGPEHLDIFYMYHCWKCGNKLLQFSGTEVMEIPGATLSSPIFSPVPMITLCRHCKQRHLFNSIL